MRVLLIGSGGREHALAKALCISPLCEALYVAPDNPGIAECATCVEAQDPVAFALENAIDLVIVGPEVPLVAGVADLLREAGIAVFGPSKAAAQLEGSKGFMKDVAARAGVSTASYQRFTDYALAAAYIEAKGAPIVIKTDGLAAGKGVVVAMTVDEALGAAKAALLEGAFGKAGTEIVIEDFLEGQEVSFFALSDGLCVKPFGSAQDHKRAFDGDKGPNTGGMGAFSPACMMTPSLEAKIMERIIHPTLAAMTAMGAPFTGVLFAGLMITPEGEPCLIEYNVRFGDPECQVLLPRLDGDLLAILDAAARGRLESIPFGWKDIVALSVVMATKGYPGPYGRGSVITGLENVKDATVLHAGTARDEEGALIAAGGRVLNVVTIGNNMPEARTKAYAAIDTITWPQGFCRRDIGLCCDEGLGLLNRGIDKSRT